MATSDFVHFCVPKLTNKEQEAKIYKF